MVTSKGCDPFSFAFYESRDTEGLPAGDAGEASCGLENVEERDGADADRNGKDAPDGGCDK